MPTPNPQQAGGAHSAGQGPWGHAHLPSKRPTCEPVGPAEPEAERVQRQGVDEVHKQMGQALHCDHQEPELLYGQHSGLSGWPGPH